MQIHDDVASRSVSYATVNGWNPGCPLELVELQGPGSCNLSGDHVETEHRHAAAHRFSGEFSTTNNTGAMP
jgi:hypothetical protein